MAARHFRAAMLESRDACRKIVERFEAAAGDLLKELGYPLATDAKPGATEYAARMRESFASDAGSRGQRLPAGWEA